MDRRFEGKVAVITGAGGGIGRAAAERFAAEGAKVVLVDLAASPLEESAAVVERAGGEALAVRADVSQEAGVESYVEAARERFGGIDCFFNNAGIEGLVTPLTEYPQDDFDRVLGVNVRGVWLGLKHVGAAMREQDRGGAIVNSSSVAGLGGVPGQVAYSASKHAVVGLTRTAALEFAGDEIRVNAVCPAPVETAMMRSIERQSDPDAPEQVKAAMARRNPMRRYGEPEEVAAVVAYLCSDDARFVTGAILPIDGGARAR